MSKKRQWKDEPFDPQFGNADSTANSVFNELMRYRQLNDRIFYNIVISSELFRAQNMYIKIIGEHEGINQSELAELMSLRRASITGALQRLEKSGFVERRPDETDKRVIRVYLTEKGKDITQQIDRDTEELINTCYKMPAEEAESFMETLRAMENRMRDYIKDLERRNNEADI